MPHDVIIAILSVLVYPLIGFLFAAIALQDAKSLDGGMLAIAIIIWPLLLAFLPLYMVFLGYKKLGLYVLKWLQDAPNRKEKAKMTKQFMQVFDKSGLVVPEKHNKFVSKYGVNKFEALKLQYK